MGEEGPLGAGAATRRSGGGFGTGVAGRVAESTGTALVAVPSGSAAGPVAGSSGVAGVAGSSGVAGTVAGSAGTLAGRGEGPL
ncbi:hypothetical protein CAC01_04060 [Streptomyces sp. CLI2509]|nr:hypothetical protein CAC01_04060 [Streptomyces sp. CLI2509]